MVPTFTPDTVLTKAQADDGTNHVQGQVTGVRLLDAITTHSTSNHALPQVARIPVVETSPVVFLTHDYTDATRADTTITPAVISGTPYYGWSNGRLFDSAGTNSRTTGCIIAITGEELSSGYVINQIWSYNRDCFANATAVRLRGTDYTAVSLESSLGSWVLNVTGTPTIPSAQTTFTFNVRLGTTDWVYETTTGTAFEAGLYEWNVTAYERLAVVPNPSGNATDTLEKLRIGSTIYRHGHPHKGTYDAGTVYNQGDIIETGSGVNSVFWIARQTISAGQGVPSNSNLGLWWQVAGHGYYRGVLDAATDYDMFVGDIYISANDFYIVLQNLTNRSGTELAGNINGIEQLVNQVRVNEDGGDISPALLELKTLELYRGRSHGHSFID